MSLDQIETRKDYLYNYWSPDTKIFMSRMMVDPFAPDEYREHAWRKLNQEMALSLYEQLQNMKVGVVVELEDDIRLSSFRGRARYGHNNFDEWYDQLVIKAHLTPVRHHVVSLPSVEMVWHPVKFPFGWLEWQQFILYIVLIMLGEMWIIFSFL